VARIAGVAPITVSRALSLPNSVAPATRERIVAAVASVGYIPNRVAGSLSENS
jgi:LacI family gluconate utilization system Gnt-I transcriptional repressor